MKIVTETHFAVPIFGVEFPGVSDTLGLENIIEEFCIEREKKEPRQPWLIRQTNGTLHKDERLKLLCESIISAVNHISVNVMEYDPKYKIEITGMWGNIQGPGVNLHRHSHHNNIFAGVIYVNEIDKSDGEFPAIEFKRPWEFQFKPSLTGDNKYTSTMAWFPVKKDLTIIFPAWLDHQVTRNLTNKDRMSISFNIMLRGRFGNIKELESTVF